MLVIEQVAVIGTAPWLVQSRCGVSADGQEPVSQARVAPVPYPVQALADRDGHRCRLRLTGQSGEFPDEMISLGVLEGS